MNGQGSKDRGYVLMIGHDMGSKKENKRKPGVQTTVSPAVHFSLSPLPTGPGAGKRKKTTYIHQHTSFIELFFPIINVGSVATGTLRDVATRQLETVKGDVTSFFFNDGQRLSIG